jgi:hypothetical protein
MASALHRALQLNRKRGGASPDRFSDVAIEWRYKGSILLAAGGQWDNVARDWTLRDAKSAIVFRPHAGQIEAAEVISIWFHCYLEYLALRAQGVSPENARLEAYPTGEPIYRIHLYGGRRAGKTRLGLTLQATIAIAIPGSRIIMLSPTHDKDMELRRAFEALIPAAWRRARGRHYDLINGSIVEFHTGGVTKDQKMGEADSFLMNEAQASSKSVYLDMAGGLADRGGVCVLAYNPPSSKRGVWVADLWKQWRDGRDKNATAHHCDPRKNPYIDTHALHAIDYDDLDNRRYILGDMDTPSSPVVFPRFDVYRHVRLCVPPEWTDVTEWVARDRLGLGGKWIGGVDFDQGAGCAWVMCKMYDRPDGGRVLLIHAGRREASFVESQLDERLLVGARRILGVQGATDREIRKMVPLVGDASGAWQHTGEGRTNRQAGRSSFDRLRSAGWRVVPPDPHSARNPNPSIKRYHLARTLLDLGRLQFLSDAAEVHDAFRQLPTKNDDTIERNRKSEHVHIVDGPLYLVYRLFCDDLELAEQHRSGGSMESRRTPPHMEGYG